MDNKKHISLIVFFSLAISLVIGMLVLVIYGRNPFEKETREAADILAAATPTPSPVTLGPVQYPVDTLSIRPEGMSYEELSDALESFTCLRELDVRAMELTTEQLQGLVGSGLHVLYEVDILGSGYSCDASAIDLSEMSAEQAGEVAAALELLPGLESVVLPAFSGDLSADLDVISLLQTSAPQAEFEYSFRLYGKSFTLNDSEMSFYDSNIGDRGTAVFYKLIPCMKNLQRLLLDDCYTSNEAMAALRDAFPQISIVWRVYWNHFSALTDVKMLRGIGTKTDSTTEALKYFTEVRFIDFGHSEDLADIEFARYMPHLQVLILADAGISSIEPLSQSSELMMLEITNCYKLADISPLSGCTSLRYLNMSNTHSVKDLSPIFDLPGLERVYASRYSVPEEQVEELKSLHPDCWVSFGMPEASNVSFNYSIGWRLDAAPNERADWYIEVRKIFGIGYELYDSQGYFSYKSSKPYEIPYDELEIFVPAE